MKRGWKRVVALVAALFMLSVAAVGEEKGSVTVQGIGAVRVDADRAGINLGVRAVAEDVMSAQSQVNEKLGAVIDAMRGMGVSASDISTSGIGIYPNYDYDDGERILGYTAHNNVYITVSDVDNTGAYIDAAFAAGANSLDYIEFSAVDTEQAAEQALKLAVESAGDKARILAQSAGMRLGDILEIRDSTEPGDSAFSSFAKSEEDSGMGSATQVYGAGQTVSASVFITYELLPADGEE